MNTILKALNNNEIYTPKKIAECTGMAFYNVQTALPNMLAKGLLEKVGHGQYRITAKGIRTRTITQTQIKEPETAYDSGNLLSRIAFLEGAVLELMERVDALEQAG